MIICKQLNIDDSTEYLPKYTSLHIENYFFKKKSLLLSRNNLSFLLTQCSVVIKRTLVLLFIDICSQIAKVLTTLLFNIDV